MAGGELQQNVNAKRLALAQWHGRSSVTGVVATVFGAGGLLGGYLVNMLGKQGTRCVVPSRRYDVDDLKALRMMGDLGQILPQQWDPHDVESIRNCIKGSNVVINLVGNIHQSRNYSYWDTNVNIVKAITQVAKEEGVEQFIQVSHAGADLDAESELYKCKAQGELEVRKAFPDAVIIRPTLMWGDGDQFFYRMSFHVRQFQFWPAFPFYNLGRRVQPVWAKDVAQAIVQSLKNGAETAGQTYELAGPDVYTMRQAWERVTNLLERHFFIKDVGFNMMGEIAKLTGKLTDVLKPLEYDEVVRWKTDLVQTPREELERKGLRSFADLNIIPGSMKGHEMRIVYSNRDEFEWGYEEAWPATQKASYASEPHMRKE